MSIEGKPLAGKRVVITRANHQAEELAVPLRALGAQTVLIPALEIQPMLDDSALQKAVVHLEDYDWLVVTSANGGDALGHAAQSQGMSLACSGLQVAAVGRGTAERLEMFGAPARHVPEDFTALDLGRLVVHGNDKKRVLLVQGTSATAELANTLAAAGAAVHRVDAYRAAVPAELFKQVGLLLRGRERADAVTFTSPQIARNFFRACEQHRQNLAEKVVVASIGPVTTQALCKLGHPPQVEAKHSRMAALAEALGEFFERAG